MIIDNMSVKEEKKLVTDTNKIMDKLIKSNFAKEHVLEMADLLLGAEDVGDDMYNIVMFAGNKEYLPCDLEKIIPDKHYKEKDITRFILEGIKFKNGERLDCTIHKEEDGNFVIMGIFDEEGEFNRAYEFFDLTLEKDDPTTATFVRQISEFCCQHNITFLINERVFYEELEAKIKEIVDELTSKDE